MLSPTSVCDFALGVMGVDAVTLEKVEVERAKQRRQTKQAQRVEVDLARLELAEMDKGVLREKAKAWSAERVSKARWATGIAAALGGAVGGALLWRAFAPRPYRAAARRRR